MLTRNVQTAAIVAAGVALLSLGGMNLYQRHVINQQADQIAALIDQQATLQARLYVYESDNQRLKDAIARQNAQLQSARLEAEESAARAERRASVAEQALREALQRDRTVTPDPEGMNQWLESLFY